MPLVATNEYGAYRSAAPECFRFSGFPWHSLTGTDRHVLTSTGASLCSPNPQSVRNACAFLLDVIFQDFPPEIFLQRPAIIQVRILKSIFFVTYFVKLAMVFDVCPFFLLHHFILLWGIVECKTVNVLVYEIYYNFGQKKINIFSILIERRIIIIILKLWKIVKCIYCIFSLLAIFFKMVHDSSLLGFFNIFWNQIFPPENQHLYVNYIHFKRYIP